MRQKAKEQNLKDKGLEHKPDKKRFHVEEHYDDCGEDVTPLMFENQIQKYNHAFGDWYTDGSDDEDLQLDEDNRHVVMTDELLRYCFYRPTTGWDGNNDYDPSPFHPHTPESKRG